VPEGERARGGGAWPASILIPAKCNACRAAAGCIRDIHEGVCVAVAVVAHA